MKIGIGHNFLMLLILLIAINTLFAENSMELIWESQGEHPYSDYGSSMTSMDYNGDGIDDLVIGSLGYEPGGGSAFLGKVYFYYGGSSFSTTPDLTITGSTANWLGKSIHNFGDVNGDGFDDLGLYRRDPIYEIKAVIDIYYGGVNCDTIPDFSYDIMRGTGDDEIEDIFSLYPLGDIDGDGCSDAGFVIWGRFSGNPFTHFYLLYGDELEPYVELWKDTGPYRIGDNSGGSAIREVGDINSDGFDDFIVGYFDAEDLLIKNSIIYGATVVDTILTNIVFQGTNFRPGGVACGDINGDSVDDFVGAKKYAGTCPGIWLGGNQSNVVPDIHLSNYGDYDNGIYYGDLNNDNYTDIVLGDPCWSLDQGKAYFFFGNEDPNGLRDYEIEAPIITSSEFGTSVAIGDFNNDGCDDVAVGAPGRGSQYAGHAYVYAGDASLYDTTVSISDDTILAPSGVEFTAYPNPFNPSVQFSVKTDKEYNKLEIQIYNVKGQLVNNLNAGKVQRDQTVTWGGVDSKGNKVASGVYLCKLTFGNTILSSVKVSLIK